MFLLNRSERKKEHNGVTKEKATIVDFNAVGKDDHLFMQGLTGIETLVIK